MSTPTVSYGVSATQIGNPILQKPQLLQALAAFEGRLEQRAKALQRRFAIGIEAQVLEIARLAGAVAVVWNGGAGEVQGAACRIGHHLDRVGILDAGHRRRSFDRGNQHGRIFHGRQQRLQVLGARQRLIALDVDVNIGSLRAGNFIDTVRAGAVRRRGQARVPAVLAAQLHDLVGIGRHDDLGYERRGTRSVVHPGQHRTPRDLAQDLARQASGPEPGRNDGDGAHGTAPL